MFHIGLETTICKGHATSNAISLCAIEVSHRSGLMESCEDSKELSGVKGQVMNLAQVLQALSCGCVTIGRLPVLNSDMLDCPCRTHIRRFNH